MIKRGQNRAFWPLLAPWRGLEPPVYRLGGGRVIHYATRAYAEYSIFCNSWRMLLLPLRRRTLYPAELPGQVRFSVLRRRYRIIVPQFAASVNAGGGFCPEFRLIFWQKKLHRSFFYGIISGRAYERRSHPVPASPRIFDRTAALPHGSDGALQDSPCQF